MTTKTDNPEVDLASQEWCKEDTAPDLIEARDHKIRKILEAVHTDLLAQRSGKVADYIPELAKVNPDLFAISITTPQGNTISVGHADHQFTIQSICKPAFYLIGLEARGIEEIGRYVGVEPTDDRFNTLELDRKGRAKNAMINAGAITIAGLISGKDPTESYNKVLDKFELFFNRRPHTDMAVFSSESETGKRNVAIANLLAASHKLDNIENALKLYYQICSLSVTTEDLALMAATFSNKGINPHTGTDVIKDKKHLMYVLTDMMNCGMYDGSGAWAHNVGIPAKSGVGGGIMGVPLNGFGIGVFSPLLNDVGNSIRGKDVFAALAERLNLNIFTQYLQPRHEAAHEV